MNSKKIIKKIWWFVKFVFSAILAFVTFPYYFFKSIFIGTDEEEDSD